MTVYPGRHYNLSMDGETESIQKSYAFGALTIATRRDGALKWVLGDHLGSTSITANADGSFSSELRYSAFGEIRYSSGTTPTDYRYTNQLSQESTGLYYYVARWYDPELARFIQADTIVPGAGNPAAYDRYAYVVNDPIMMNDPSGRNCKKVLGPGQYSEEECGDIAIAYPGQSAKGEVISNLLRTINKSSPDYMEIDIGEVRNPDSTIKKLRQILLGFSYIDPSIKVNDFLYSNDSIPPTEDVLSFVDTFSDISEVAINGSGVAHFTGIPLFGGFIAGYSQWKVDEINQIPESEKILRALVVASEDELASAVSIAFGTALVSTVPWFPPLGIGVYLTTNTSLTSGATLLNRNNIFPFIHNSIINIGIETD